MKPLVEQLARIDLADTTRPGGVRARVEEVADLIHADIEAAHTGHPVPVVPITTANRSTAA
ncbi:hypothetical protein ACWGKS_27145 [Nocardiopsis sp. NPDC055879]